MTYIVAGVTTKGRRFVLSFSSLRQALGINLWRGSVWEVRGDRRKLLRRVWN